ncbi:hypothetical protein MA03_07130 [Infirmifilum uzonense]|uniref:Uncharacterized protein n=1 Tax=Infirmifilum uzonense TaxID=1550241 RepID=A0A0F7FJ78_9CREN|nr:hypothetical protein MA03_07130 [Infirmifilum uzonense]
MSGHKASTATQCFPEKTGAHERAPALSGKRKQAGRERGKAQHACPAQQIPWAETRPPPPKPPFFYPSLPPLVAAPPCEGVEGPVRAPPAPWAAGPEGRPPE